MAFSLEEEPSMPPVVGSAPTVPNAPSQQEPEKELPITVEDESPPEANKPPLQPLTFTVESPAKAMAPSVNADTQIPGQDSEIELDGPEPTVTVNVDGIKVPEADIIVDVDIPDGI